MHPRRTSPPKDKAFLIQEGRIPLIKARAPFLIIGTGFFMGLLSLGATTILSIDANKLKNEERQQAYAHAIAVGRLGEILATALVAAGCTALQSGNEGLRGESQRNEDRLPWDGTEKRNRYEPTQRHIPRGLSREPHPSRRLTKGTALEEEAEYNDALARVDMGRIQDDVDHALDGFPFRELE